jgi:hypothetical protein
MVMPFAIGQLVVCVYNKDPDPNFRRLCWSIPALNGIYTVRGYSVPPQYRELYGLGLLLEEIVNPQRQYREAKFEPGFNPEAFRALDDLAAAASTEPVRLQ